MEDNAELIAEIEAQVNDWSTNSTECTTIELVSGDGAVAASFQPEFTYPIFGDEEAIFGYRDLSINLSFAAHNLRPHLSIKHGKVFPAQGEIKATDIKEALADFLPKSAFTSESREKVMEDGDAATFTPPGSKIHSYRRDGKDYEIWFASLADSKARELLDNVQTLVPMFIEGGSILELEHDWTTQRWHIFFVYEKAPSSAPSTSPYTLVGYGTSYRFFAIPDRQNPLKSDVDLFSSSEPLDSFLPAPNAPAADRTTAVKSPPDLPSRERLSQFLILPPFQKSGHGSELYHTMYKHLATPSNIREFTIEDPNEGFDELRDLCDLLYLRKTFPEFNALRINTSIPAEAMKLDSAIPTDLLVPIATRQKIQAESKIMARQFDRLVEAHTLSFIPALHQSRARISKKEKSSNEHDKAYYFWRLYAKQRLYVFNRDQLAQVEQAERVDKLEAALDGVVEGYTMLLERAAEREKNGETVGGAEKIVRKRKVIDDDEDEDEDEEANGSANGHKKARSEDE